MPVPVLLSTIFIILGLLFYSIGVWSERLAGRLKTGGLVCFWLIPYLSGAVFGMTQ